MAIINSGLQVPCMGMNSEFRLGWRELSEPTPQSLIHNGLEGTIGFSGEIRDSPGEIIFQS
jgi:hypothetical protein